MAQMFLDLWVNKMLSISMRNVILSLKKDTHVCHMYAKLESDTKGHLLCDSFYMK